MPEPADILALEESLVSPLCGIVRRLHRVYKDLSEPPVPFIWRAEIANHQFSAKPNEAVTTASGKGFDHGAARRGALGEAVERYCALRYPAERIRTARRGDLPGRSLDPAELVLYAPDQYRTLPYSQYAETNEIDWTQGECLTDGDLVWLPAEAIWLGLPPQPLMAQQTSNGLAAGATRDAAILRALLEVVERDAFMIAWYNRLEARRIDWRSLPNPQIRDLAEAYRRRGVEIELVRLPADHSIPVFAAMGIEPDGAAVVVGLGCDPCPVRAAAGAILEVGQVRPALRMRLRDPAMIERREALLADPGSVRELEDHDLLYTHPRMLGAFDMWRGNVPESGDWNGRPASAARDAVRSVVEELTRVGAACHVGDVTTPDIAAMGLSVVRAIIEDFQPIHFGEDEARLGGRRLYELPARLGLRQRPATRAELNPLPHPLS